MEYTMEVLTFLFEAVLIWKKSSCLRNRMRVVKKDSICFQNGCCASKRTSADKGSVDGWKK